ncbi:MAG TPA: signal peptidase I [Bryobacteraceae bacterium]|jgi:signal peptidase I|nr:signal peptidase I [Bryobacteraceae bacterium]
MIGTLRSWWSRLPRGPVNRGFVAEWTVNLIFLLFCWTSLLQAYVIPSGSMENSLLVGDHLFVDRLTYAPAGSVSKHLLPYRDVRRGDVIVFRSPVENLTLVKRAIGVPGDHIRLLHKQLILNGKAMNEPYANHIEGNFDPYRDDFPSAAPVGLHPRALEMLESDVVNGELVVPPGFVFAMGDNRENSNDSRFWGLVPRENIEGTPVVIYWSFDAPTEDLSNPNIGFDHVMDVVTHFFTKTRWRRTLHFVRGYPLGA